MAKHALIIAYYFPPMGMGGVQRMTKLAKYLPRFGYDVTVLTVKPVLYPAFDESLLSELPEEVKIIRSGSRDPARIARLLPIRFTPGAKITTAAKNKGGFWPDSKIGWRGPALKAAEKLLGRQKADIILSSSPPITGHLIARELKERHSLHWIADFRDIWESRPPEQLYDDRDLIDRSNRLLAEITETADAVTTINDTIAGRLTDRAAVIMGGYDIDDFADMTVEEDERKFSLCYLGTVGPLHPLEPFFEAVRQASAINADFAARVSFKIIGANDVRGVMETAARFRMDNRVEMTGYLPHREALRQSSTASVSIMSVPEGYGDIMTGKIFDLLALPLPILASVPEGGEAEKLIETYHGGLCIEPDRPDRLAEAMLRLFEDNRSGRAWIKEDLSEFTRLRAAEEFARLMDGMCHG